MDIITFSILSLATWRISSLFVNPDEVGPFGVFTKIRELAGIVINEYGQVDSLESTGFFAELLSCVWCFSIYVGIAITFSYWAIPVYTTWFLLPFALSTIAIIINGFTNG